MEKFIIIGREAGSFLRRFLKYRKGHVGFYRKLRYSESDSQLESYHNGSSYYEIIIVPRSEYSHFKETHYGYDTDN